MTANTNPIFIITPNIGQARIAAVNTARDGSGTLATIFTAGVNGSVVWEIKVTSAQAAAAACSNMMIRIFMTDTGGANPRLLDELIISATTASNTAPGGTASIIHPGGLGLKAGQLLKACQSVYAGVQDQMDYHVKGGDF